MSPDKIISRAMSLLNARRKTHGAGTGRPPKLEPCPKCGAILNATQRRGHECQQAPVK